MSKEYINVTPSVGLLADGQSQDIVISANCPWTVSKPADASWLTVTPSSGTNSQTITVTAGRNTAATSRTAVLTIAGSTRSATVTVTQSGQTAQLSVDKSSLTFATVGGTEIFSITSNSSWDVTAPDWCGLSQASGEDNAQITVTVSTNTTTSTRSGNIQVTGNGKTATISVSQSPASTPTVADLQVTNVTTSTADCSFTISSDLSVTACGVCYSSDGLAPTITNNHVDVPSPGIGTFTLSLSGLHANTIYCVRAYATNAVGTTYSQAEYITTQKQKPGEGDNPTPAKKK